MTTISQSIQATVKYEFSSIKSVPEFVPHLRSFFDVLMPELVTTV